MAKWKQLQTDVVNEPSPCGSKEVNTYEVRLTSTGHKTLKKTGKINLYDRIQASKDECDVQKIITRAKMGDVNAIARIQNTSKTYGDMTQAPKTLLQAKQMIIDAEKEFAKLPEEIRAKFNNNPNEFLAGIENGKIKEALEGYLKDKGAIKEETQAKQETKEGEVL